MLFPTHLLAGYVVGRRWDLPLAWTVAGAALPDVLDKPLAMVGLTELYQTVGHSLPVFVGAGILVLAGRERGTFSRGTAAALLAGWASHLLLDATHMVLNGRPADVLFLAWPVIDHVPAVQLPPLAFFAHYLWTPSFFVEVAMWLAVGAVAIRERVPP